MTKKKITWLGVAFILVLLVIAGTIAPGQPWSSQDYRGIHIGFAIALTMMLVVWHQRR